MQRVSGGIVHRREEVPQEALTWRLWQECAAVFALLPAHAIRTLAPEVLTFAVTDGGAECRAG